MSIERLRKALGETERTCEDDIIEAAAALPNADILADVVERAVYREYITGVTDGTKKLVQVVVDELAEARAHDMA